MTYVRFIRLLFSITIFRPWISVFTIAVSYELPFTKINIGKARNNCEILKFWTWNETSGFERGLISASTKYSWDSHFQFFDQSVRMSACYSILVSYNLCSVNILLPIPVKMCLFHFRRTVLSAYPADFVFSITRGNICARYLLEWLFDKYVCIVEQEIRETWKNWAIRGPVLCFTNGPKIKHLFSRNGNTQRTNVTYNKFCCRPN